MEQIHDEHPDMGYRRIRDILEHDYNIKVNDKRVLRICRKKKIRSIIKHRGLCSRKHTE
ncbi:transposase [Bilifractor sp. LCP21S3_A7]|uniref:transposase n=1 Tax=Bilifractor sp. LCP21S3_A7 TaxID=3438738 RepID=UPI003F915B2C